MNEPIATDPGAAAPRGRSRRRSLLLSLVALLVLGGAGWSIWASVGNEIQTAAAQIREDWNKPQPPTPEEVTKAQEARSKRHRAATRRQITASRRSCTALGGLAARSRASHHAAASSRWSRRASPATAAHTAAQAARVKVGRAGL